MIDLSKYRIIDLTAELVPGERKMDGHYLHGRTFYDRPIEVQEFVAYGARMHFIQGQTHCGTHSEAPYKYSETGADFLSMPLESYIGEAAACNFSHKKPGETITAEDFRKAGVRQGDIVLAWGKPGDEGRLPYITTEATDWLIETRIKCLGLGLGTIMHSPPGTPFGLGDADAKLLLAGVSIVDALVGLEQITKPRVFFIALPARLGRVTASWTRAIALEDID
jgi:kynurenine formamidase